MLAVHHWDTDGITSAAITISAISPENYVNATPDLRRMHLDERIRKLIDSHDDVYVLDLNLPGEMEHIQSRVRFIDHHIQARIVNPLIVQINPVVEGLSPAEFPSASIVVSKHFNRWNHLSSLGAIGDIGSKAFDNPVVMKQLDNAGLGKEESLRIVDMIDSNYVVMDREGVEKAVGILLQADPADLLEVPEWNHNLEKINSEIGNHIEMAEVKGDMAYLEFSSDHQIISKLARKLVWEMGNRIAVVVNRDFNGNAQIYVRIAPDMTGNFNMYHLINSLNEIGVNCGGKAEVIGSIFEKERIDQVKNIIFNQLGKEENNI